MTKQMQLAGVTMDKANQGVGVRLGGRLYPDTSVSYTIVSDVFTIYIDVSNALAASLLCAGRCVSVAAPGRSHPGVGCAPWNVLAAQLPPSDKWGGFLDGFDGSVRSFD